MRPVPKLKTLSLSKCKEKAWNAFSKYIRLRDAIKTTGTKDRALCVTCGNDFPAFGKGCIQAGHFLPGRHAGILFDEKNVHAQCVICNRFRRGEYAKYTRFMQKTYGQAEIDRLLQTELDDPHFKAYQYLEIADLFKNKLEELS